MAADIDVIERIIGREALEMLIRTCGGLSIAIPKRLPMRGPLGELPQPVQAALAAYAGGDTIYVPKYLEGAARAARDAEIRELHHAGWRVRDIARRYRLSERWVYEILSA